MPAISAHQYDDAQSVLDTIGRQLTIADEQLIEITKTFVDEFHLGLNSYGKDMAMMCVLSCIYTQPGSQVRSRPTFVTGVPNGTEKGYERLCESATSKRGVLMSYAGPS